MPNLQPSVYDSPRSRMQVFPHIPCGFSSFLRHFPKKKNEILFVLLNCFHYGFIFPRLNSCSCLHIRRHRHNASTFSRTGGISAGSAAELAQPREVVASLLKRETAVGELIAECWAFYRCTNSFIRLGFPDAILRFLSCYAATATDNPAPT